MQRFTGKIFELRQYENEWISSIKRVVIYRWLKAWFACAFFACANIDRKLIKLYDDKKCNFLL